MDLDFVAFVFLTCLGDLIFANSLISSPNDITSTMATWATVAVALGGVAGPLLVCRASRTARNVAITALDAGTAENGGFISKGFRFSPGIRLLRRVNAPTLSKTPRYTEWTIRWKNVARLVLRAGSCRTRRGRRWEEQTAADDCTSSFPGKLSCNH
jgi:hypothetical protein